MKYVFFKIVAILLSIVLFLFAILWIVFGAISLIWLIGFVIVGIIVFVTDRFIARSKWYKCLFFSNIQYPTNEWYRNNYERDFDRIYLGSDKIIVAKNERCLDWRKEKQSLTMTFVILKNYFSILKQEGEVYIYIDSNNKNTWNSKEKHESLYYHSLIDYAISNNDRELLWLKLCKQFPVCMFLQYMGECFICSKNSKYTSFEDFKKDMIVFAEERNIILKFVFVV